MGKIKQLPLEVANQISAGEVIARPASVVKELVENSIDAGSDQILIEIENGGKDSIRVQDNGSGIGEDELELAFSRYATSKIEDINDLYSLRTLGFRGEALASIASVSRLEIRSRTAEQLRGKSLQLEGGRIIKREPAAVSRGTDIIVRDLFFNTPARFKYLKTVNTEFGHISNIVEREALARPGIKFTLNHNGKKVLNTPGSGKQLDAIYTLFGSDLAENLIEVDFADRYIKVSGFLANPNFYRSSRLYQYFFVNNRVVYNPVLSRGLEEGYRGLLPSGARPIAFLNLKLNQILVDINVHPTKREVKFSRDEIIQDVLKRGIRKVLSAKGIAPRLNLKKRRSSSKPAGGNYSINDLQTAERVEKGNGVKAIADGVKEIEAGNADLNPRRQGETAGSGNERDKGDKRDKKNKGNEGNERNHGQQGRAGIDFTGNRNERRRSIRKDIEVDDVDTVNEVDAVREVNETEKDGGNVEFQKTEGQSREKIKRLLGQISGTYLLAEGEDGLYIIDQHNAHERVRYERLKGEYNKGRVVSQSLLLPVNLETNLQEAETIRHHLEELEKMGFTLEEFGGGSFLVQEIPVQLKNAPLKNVLRDIIDRLLTTGKSADPADLSEQLITLISCRGAVKAGKPLGREEMEGLLRDLFKAENPYRCPHGRPIMLKITGEEIAREMGRSAG